MNGKMQESGFTEIIPFICISAVLGQYPVFFSTPWTPLGFIIGSVSSLMASRSQVFFSFLSALKAHVGGLPSLMTVTSCLLIGQEILHFSVPPHGQKFDPYLGYISWPVFVPRHWEAYPRSGETSPGYVTPGVNIWIRPIDR